MNRSRNFKMNKKIRNIAVLMVSAFALGQGGEAWAADANPPERMTYQGFLVDGNGDPLGNSAPANYDVIFRLYDAKSGGTKLWTEQQTVTVDKGYFSVLLGEGSQYESEPDGSLSAVFDGDSISDRYIGIAVQGLDAGNTEIAPRLMLVSSPFAFTAKQARTLTDGAGNINIRKNGSALEIGPGSTPTLTLEETGGATLSGRLTSALDGYGHGLEVSNGNEKTTFGGLSTGYFHIATDLSRFDFNKAVRSDNGFLVHATRGIGVVTGGYGTVQTIGTGANGWNGYSIDGRYVFMSNDGSTDDVVGLYNDVDDKWLWKNDRINEHQQWLVRGHERMRLTDTGAVLDISTTLGGGIELGYGDPAGTGVASVVGHTNIRLKPGSYNNGLTMIQMGMDYIGTDYPGFRLVSQYGSPSSHRKQGSFLIQQQADPANADSNSWLPRLSINGKGNIGIGREDAGDHELFIDGADGEPASLFIRSRGNDHYEHAYIKLHQVNAGGSKGTFVEFQNDGYNDWYLGKQGAQSYFGFWEVVNGQHPRRLSIQADGLYAAGFHNSSDQRIKTDIVQRDTGKALQNILELPIVEYRYKKELASLYASSPGKVHVGVVAQNVEKLIPDAVNVGDDLLSAPGKKPLVEKVKTVTPDRIFYELVAGFQQHHKQSTEIDHDLEKRLDSLEKQYRTRIEELESEVEVLKARLANSTTQEDRIAKLEELVSKIGQGE
jgi:hypothetical protein